MSEPVQINKGLTFYFKASIQILREDGLIAFIKKFWYFLQRVIPGIVPRKVYIDGFHRLYQYDVNTWQNTYWFGVKTLKCPLDLWVYQEIIWELRPDILIETGSAHGGTAMYFAALFDLIGHGEVITIDVADFDVSHPRITKIIGDSVSSEVISTVQEKVGNKTAMVVLDSDHRKEHVLEEMKLYSKFISIGNYMVVEDTDINNHPVLPGWGPGPMEAVEEFLSSRNDFEVDRSREKFMLTCSPKGWLERIS